MRKLAAVLVLAGVALSAWAFMLLRTAAPDDASALKEVLRAPAQFTYSATGRMKSLYGGKLVESTVKVFHEKPNKCRIEYLSPPLKGLITGDNGRNMWRYDPKLKKVVVMDSAGCGMHADRVDLLLKNHRVETTGKTRIARKSAHMLVVKSKSGRVQKRLWVDERTRIVLRSEEHDESGKLLASTSFDRITYVRDLPDKLFERPSSGRLTVSQQTGGIMSLSELSKTVGFTVKAPRYIPRGYKLDGYRLFNCPCGCGHKSAYIRYTNGLDSISVFETLGSSGCARDDKCRTRGHEDTCVVEDSARGRVATLSSGGKLFTVIGDLSRSELEKIARSLRGNG